jgi:phage terminase small subunit
MNSLFEQGEIVTSSPSGDDKRNPNAKIQMTIEIQMLKFQNSASLSFGILSPWDRHLGFSFL